MCVEALAQAIAEASWREVLRQVEDKEDKAAGYGRILVQIDTGYPSSQRCSACGHIRASSVLRSR